VRRTRSYNLVFAVCHPDDEALWVGGLLCELARLPFIKAYVVCLSGNDSHSPRMGEFDAARESAGYAGGVILGFPLRPAPDPLPDTALTLQEGLARLDLLERDVDLVITHSSYGDEHKHPHHRQAFSEIGRWCARADIPFGYFSCLPLTWLRHLPFAVELRRLGTLHLLNASKCERIFSDRHYEADPDRSAQFESPKYYLQFLTDAAAKTRMLNCYQSINLAQHERGYAMFTSACEAIYLSDDRAFAPWRAVIDAMEVPADCALIPLVHSNDPALRWAVSAAARLRNLLSRLRRRLGSL
jgi:LmbE family N-acetylglucosaminyl deacetylase